MLRYRRRMTSLAPPPLDSAVHVGETGGLATSGVAPLERRGRRWIFASFVLCPCHLPLTLGVLVTVLGGTSAGAVLRGHVLLAGSVITAAWVVGTWRGFRLVRLAQRGACPLPAKPKVQKSRTKWPSALGSPKDARHDGHETGRSSP